MSIMIPPEFEPIAKVTVGQEFPLGDEDKLTQLGEVWDQAAEEINQLIGELNPATAATFESLEGAPAEQFAEFVNQLGSTLPVMSGSAQQLATLARNVALEIEYAKYMIILQLAWMAAEIAYLTSTLFGSAAVPAVITAGRFAIQMILRELFTAIIASVVMAVGMDVAVQVLQFLKGDRKHWDIRATESMAEMGALGGALGGVLQHAMRVAVPDFAKSLVGHVTTGALAGMGAVELNNAVFNAGQNVGLGAAAGAVGGAIAHGHSLRGGGDAQHIDVPEIDIKPFTPEMMKQALSGDPAGAFGRPEQPGSVPGKVPGEHPTEGGHPAAQEEQLHLPEVPKPFDASRLPDPSPEALATDFPSVPGQKPIESAALRPQVTRRVNVGYPEDPHEARLRQQLDAAPGAQKGQKPSEHVPITEHAIDELPSASAHKPEPLPDAPATRPDTTAPAENRQSVEDLPSAPASPLARYGEAQAGTQAGTQAHEQAPTQAGAKRVEPSTVRPGAEVAQAQRSRPAADTEPPSTPTADPRVDRATMHARVPQVADLEKTLAELEAHDTPAQPPKPNDVRTEAAGPEQPPARTETPADHLTHPDTAGTPTTDHVTGMPRAAEHTTPATPATAVPKPPPLPAPAALRAAPPQGLARRSGSERAPQEMVRPVADPVRPEQWQHRRANASSSVLRAERFDPLRGRPAGDGTLPGRTTLIHAEVRRVQAEDGRWVRDLTLHLPVRLGEGFPARMLPEFEQRWRAALDGHFNTGLRLPRSGDQLHIGLRLTPVADDRAAVELSMSAAPGASDQTHFRLRQEDPAADPVRLQVLRQRNDLLGLHELAHFVGLSDTYLDPESVFRDTAANSDGAGIMADITRAPGEGVPRHYLEAIENAVDSGPVVRDHPLSVVRDHPLSTDVPTTVGATDHPEPLRQIAAEVLAPGDGVRLGDRAVVPVAEHQEVVSPQTVSRELRLPGAVKRPDGLRVIVSRTRQADGADVRSLSLVDAQGRPLETLRVEPHLETDASTGRPVTRVALVPTGAPDAPRQRLVIDGVTGQPVHETLAHRDGLGFLSHYTRYEHDTRKLDVLDGSGRPVSSWLAGGRLLLRKLRYLGVDDLPSHGLPPLGTLGTLGTRPGPGARPDVPVGPSRWPSEPGTGMRMPFRGEDVFGPRPLPGHGLPWRSASPIERGRPLGDVGGRELPVGPAFASPAPGARAAGFRPELGEPPIVSHQGPDGGATGPSSHWAYQVAKELLTDMGSRTGEPDEASGAAPATPAEAQAQAHAPRVASAAPAAAMPRFARSSRFELVNGLYLPVSIRDRGDETPLELSAAGRTSEAPWDEYADDYPDSYYMHDGRVPHGPSYGEDENVIVFGPGASMDRVRAQEREHAENLESVENRERTESEARERAPHEQAEQEQARRERQARGQRAASEREAAERALREHDEREKARQDQARREREALRRALRTQEEHERARREEARREREPFKRALREKKERDQADQRAVLKRALRTQADREKEARDEFRRERAASERALRTQEERDQAARNRARREREALKRALRTQEERDQAAREEAAAHQAPLSRSSSTSSMSPLHSIDENDPAAPEPYRPTVQPPYADGAGPSRYRGPGAPDGYQAAPQPYHYPPQPFHVNDYQAPPQQPYRHAVDRRPDDWGTVYVVLAGVATLFVLSALMDPRYYGSWGYEPAYYRPWGYRPRYYGPRYYGPRYYGPEVSWGSIFGALGLAFNVARFFYR